MKKIFFLIISLAIYSFGYSQCVKDSLIVIRHISSSYDTPLSDMHISQSEKFLIKKDQRNYPILTTQKTFQELCLFIYSNDNHIKRSKKAHLLESSFEIILYKKDTVFLNNIFAGKKQSYNYFYKLLKYLQNKKLDQNLCSIIESLLESSFFSGMYQKPLIYRNTY